MRSHYPNFLIVHFLFFIVQGSQRIIQLYKIIIIKIFSYLFETIKKEKQSRSLMVSWRRCWILVSKSHRIIIWVHSRLCFSNSFDMRFYLYVIHIILNHSSSQFPHICRKMYCWVQFLMNHTIGFHRQLCLQHFPIIMCCLSYIQ